jgi:predicted RNase H-like HicB family nuclease
MSAKFWAHEPQTWPGVPSLRHPRGWRIHRVVCDVCERPAAHMPESGMYAPPGDWGASSMPKPKYEVIIYWSADDEAFIAEVPELPGCAADGKTRREALSSVETVIQGWIETATELGRPIPQPKGRLVFA